MFAVHRRLERPRLRFVRLGVPGFAGRLRVAHLSGLRCDGPAALERAALALDLVSEAQPDLVAITGGVAGREDRIVSILAGLEAPALAVLDRAKPQHAFALRQAGVQLLPCGWLRRPGANLGLAADPEEAPLHWARGTPLVLAGAPTGRSRYRAGWYAETPGDRLVQLYVNPGPVQREVAILDIQGGPVREPVERPWDFAA